MRGDVARASAIAPPSGSLPSPGGLLASLFGPNGRLVRSSSAQPAVQHGGEAFGEHLDLRWAVHESQGVGHIKRMRW